MSRNIEIIQQDRERKANKWQEIIKNTMILFSIWLDEAPLQRRKNSLYISNTQRIVIWNKTLLCKAAKLNQPHQEKIRFVRIDTHKHNLTYDNWSCILHRYLNEEETKGFNSQLMRRAPRCPGFHTMTPGEQTSLWGAVWKIQKVRQGSFWSGTVGRKDGWCFYFLFYLFNFTFLLWLHCTAPCNSKGAF